jgi:predicted AAA+ superfamily ATPase
MIQRELEVRIRDLAQKMPAVAIVGPRQSGKTTLVQAVFPEYLYASLEDPDTYNRLEADPRGFLERALLHPGLIIDEFQRMPPLVSYLQGFIDRSKKPGFFILTGSQNYLMMQSISQSLAGRMAILTLLPLSHTELSAAGKLSSDFVQAAWRGFYPRSFAPGLEPRDWVNSYIEQYIERDVRQITAVKDLRTFQRFIGLCAGRVGQLLNISSLAVEADINQATVKQWLSLLEASYLIKLVQPWHTNTNKRLVKAPKLYFTDTGLVCALLNIATPEQLMQHYSLGSIFENMVVMELLKHRYNQGDRSNLYFIRGSRGEEVDVVLEYANHVRLVEVKATATIHTGLFKGLRYWQQNINTKTVCFLISGGTQAPSNIGDITTVSWQQCGQIVDEEVKF